MICRILGLPLLALALVSGAKNALAQDWMLGSSITQRGTYDSNVLFTPTNRISAFGSTTIPELKLKREGPTSSITLDGAFDFTEYFGHSDLDSQNQNISLDASKDLSERSTLNFDGHFSHDTTLNSDRDIDGQFLNKQIQIISWDVAPSWTYQLSPTDTINWAGTYQSISYLTTSSAKTDYQFYGTTLAYSHQLSDVAAVTGTLNYFRYVPDDAFNSSTDIYGGLIGYRYSPTERFSINGAGGLNYTVHHSDQQSTSTGVGYRVKFNTTYQLNDQTQAQFDLSRDEEPSGEGRTVTRDRGSLSLSYLFSELTVLSLHGSYSDNAKVGSENSQSNEGGTARFFSVSPAVTWNITDQLSLEASYRFKYKIFASSEAATDNAAFLTLRYGFQDQHWSGF